VLTGGVCDADQAILATCGRPGSVGGIAPDELRGEFLDVDDRTVEASIRATDPAC
jgi:hypothetical protein